MLNVVKTALMITAFVSVMMLLVEYLHVVTGGAWQKRLANHRWGQYLLWVDSPPSPCTRMEG
jgi:hypothetical protein